MNFSIDEPSHFFRKIHPSNAGGKVVLSRKIRGATSRSEIHAIELENVARSAAELPDFSFSVAAFNGNPLILNFQSVSALHLTFKNDGGFEKRTQIEVKLSEIGIPLPTCVIEDQKKSLFVFLWILDRPLGRDEFFRYFMLQEGLKAICSQYKPVEKEPRIDWQIPLVGTMNSRSGSVIGISEYKPNRTLTIEHAEATILRCMNSAEVSRLRKLSSIALDLEALFHNRIFYDWNRVSEDCVLIFGCVLANFCSEKQLRKELQALSESIANRNWPEIKGEFEPLVESIVKQRSHGCIEVNGKIFDPDQDWAPIIKHKLAVTEEEIDRLGLYAIGQLGQDYTVSHLKALTVGSFGFPSFVPVNRLLLKEAPSIRKAV